VVGPGRQQRWWPMLHPKGEEEMGRAEARGGQERRVEGESWAPLVDAEFFREGGGRRIKGLDIMGI
jgi:hypothetical protein